MPGSGSQARVTPTGEEWLARREGRGWSGNWREAGQGSELDLCFSRYHSFCSALSFSRCSGVKTRCMR